jgi:predicted phage terminase large subunit-like protein
LLSSKELAPRQADALLSLAVRGLAHSERPWLAPWGTEYGFDYEGERIGIEGMVTFGEYVYGNSCERHHAEMLMAIQRAIYRREHTVVLMPRGGAKTTWANTTLGTRLAGEFPNIRIGLMSNTTLQSHAFSRAARSTLEASEKYQEIYGDLVSKEKWTDAQWIRKGSDLINTKDVTMFAQGVGGAIISKRFDVIICDDILDEENTETPEAREKVRQWFFQTLYPCLAPDGVIIVIGTRWAAEDLYEELYTPISKGGKGWNLHLQKAIITHDEETGEELDEPVSYWPEYWPMERLEATRRDLGTPMFMCAYQNDIRGLLEGNVFKASDWQRDDFYFQSLPQDRTYTVRMGVDLASSEKERADFTARATVAEDNHGDFWILSIYRDKRESGHAEFVRDGWSVYPDMSLVIIENQQFQSTLIQEIMEDYPYIPVEGKRSDVDKVTRARAVAAKYEAGKMHHHISLKGGDYEMEALSFPKDHDDMIDAVGFAMDLGGGGGLVYGAARR